MHQNDNFVNVFVLVVFCFSAGQSSVFQFITQPPGWCCVRCFPMKCSFFCCRPMFVCYYASWTTKLVSNHELSSDFALWRLRRRLPRIVFGALEGNSMEGTKVFSRIEMPGATELPRVWARVSPRVTPCVSLRASPRVSPCASHRI